jgi:hypothetical protein
MTTEEPAALPEIATLLDGLESAESDEAAAVAAAIGAHLRDQAAAAAAADGEEPPDWSGRKWAYADRLDRDRGRGVRVADGTPVDPWAAAGRADRL